MGAGGGQPSHTQSRWARNPERFPRCAGTSGLSAGGQQPGQVSGELSGRGPQAWGPGHTGLPCQPPSVPREGEEVCAQWAKEWRVSAACSPHPRPGHHALHPHPHRFWSVSQIHSSVLLSRSRGTEPWPGAKSLSSVLVLMVVDVGKGAGAHSSPLLKGHASSAAEGHLGSHGSRCFGL